VTATTLLFHLANALYLLAYLVRDILWLRLVTVLAGTALLTTFLLQPSPPWAAIAWNLVFLIINSRATSASSWTATGAGRGSRGCRARSGTSTARTRCGGWSGRRARRGSRR
jgi:hypothetical protein